MLEDYGLHELAWDVADEVVNDVLVASPTDAREWCHVFVYDDGLVEFTAAGAADASRELVASGRMCVNAHYNAAGVIPGFSRRTGMRTVSLRADMGSFAYVSMAYWFYSLTALTSISGLGNLAHVHEMAYAFASCSGLAQLDFRGFDPSGLTNLNMCFGGCTGLATMLADASWALPAGASGTHCFYNCTSLVGGAGTAYDPGSTAASSFRIDTASAPGYLTAA